MLVHRHHLTKPVHGFRNLARILPNTGNRRLGFRNRSNALGVLLGHVIQLAFIVILPFNQLLNRFIQLFEVIAKLLGQVLVEVGNHLAQRIDHRLRGRL